MEWQLIVSIIVGLLLGVLSTLLFQRFRKPHSLAELENAHNKLREDVMEHFVTTANLVNDMTDSYKAVFDHLNEGATRLVDAEELRNRLPQEDAPLVTLSRIGQLERARNPDPEDEHSNDEDPEQSEPDPPLEPPRF